MSDSPDLLRLLGEAIAALGADRPETVTSLLGDLPDEGGPMGRALLLVAGVRQADDAELAMRRLEQAYTLGPALPAVAARILTEAGWEHGRRLVAQHAFLQLQLVEPGALQERVRALPTSDRARYAGWAMRSSWWAREQDLYGLAGFKGALRERLGPEAAALVLADMRWSDGKRVVARRTITRLIDHARESGLDYEELIAAGPTASSGVRAFRRPAAEPDERRGRALFGCVLRDVVVTARSGILLTGDRALMDVQDDELSRRPHDLSVDPLVAAADGDALLLLEPADRDALPKMPEAVWLGGVHSVAFGHWIIEFLPKVWALMDRPGFGSVPLLVDARMPDQHLEAVRLFAGTTNPVRVLGDHESVRVERLWVASALSYLPVGPLPAPHGARTRIGLDDTGFRRLLDRVAPTLDALADPASPRRLHLKRRPGQHRRLVDAEAVEGQLAAAGFTSVDFGSLPFTEQVRLVRGAEWVVGPSGSALLNAIFGRPGLRVGALLPPFLRDVGWLAQASRALGIELTAIVGEVVQEHPTYRWMSDYRIDRGELAAYLGSVPEPPTGPYVRVSS
jgi:capsular polysaccharide biosynthesis protein